MDTRPATSSDVRTRVVIADPIDESAVIRLREHFEVDVLEDPANLVAEIGDAAAVVIRSASTVDADVIAAGTKLQIVARAGVGLDNVDKDAAEAANVTVVNTPSANSVSAAEHAFALLLAVARHIPQANATLRSHRWDRSSFTGVELAGKTIAVLGLGRIGRLVARRAQAFDMNVIGFDPNVDAGSLPPWLTFAPHLQQAIADADFVTLHLPLTDTTHNLLDSSAFAGMKNGVRIINAARGGVVNEAALLDALNQGKVAGGVFIV